MLSPLTRWQQGLLRLRGCPLWVRETVRASSAPSKVWLQKAQLGPCDVYSEKPPRSGSTLPPRKQPGPSASIPFTGVCKPEVTSAHSPTRGSPVTALRELLSLRVAAVLRLCWMNEGTLGGPACAPSPPSPRPRLSLAQATGAAPLPSAWRQPGPWQPLPRKTGKFQRFLGDSP